MNQNSDVYQIPKANLEEGRATLKANFKSLNFWRKLYLVLNWLFALGLIVGWFFLMIASDQDTGQQSLDVIVSAVLGAMILGFTIWTHWAIVKRRVGHLTAITILNLIPFGNILGCLIMLSIRRVTVKEHEEFNVVE